MIEVEAKEQPDGEDGGFFGRDQLVQHVSGARDLLRFLEWTPAREFRNRRQLGGLLGFTPTPYASGASQREQGISGAGNARLQAVSIQLAWNWVRWQPHSALTQWYQARVGTGKRARRIGIVAVARKLVIALWRYVTQGIVPTGAIVNVA